MLAPVQPTPHFPPHTVTIKPRRPWCPSSSSQRPSSAWPRRSASAIYRRHKQLSPRNRLGSEGRTETLMHTRGRPALLARLCPALCHNQSLALLRRRGRRAGGAEDSRADSMVGTSSTPGYIPITPCPRLKPLPTCPPPSSGRASRGGAGGCSAAARPYALPRPRKPACAGSIWRGCSSSESPSPPPKPTTMAERAPPSRTGRPAPGRARLPRAAGRAAGPLRGQGSRSRRPDVSEAAEV
jgi:hypothetical protein